MSVEQPHRPHSPSAWETQSLLREVFERTGAREFRLVDGGHAKGCGIAEVAKALGLDDDAAHSTIDYLLQAGLLVRFELEGRVHITRQGRTRCA